MVQSVEVAALPTSEQLQEQSLDDELQRELTRTLVAEQGPIHT